MVKLSDLELAYDFVSSSSFDASGYVCRETGETFLKSEEGDLDDLPDDVETNDRYVALPDKFDLNLGHDLVHDFVSEYLPERSDEVYSFFRRKGAYSKFKDLLIRTNMQDKWYEFKNARTYSALIEWCKENNIAVEDDCSTKST